jgi:hypothetical protein
MLKCGSKSGSTCIKKCSGSGPEFFAYPDYSNTEVCTNDKPVLYFRFEHLLVFNFRYRYILEAGTGTNSTIKNESTVAKIVQVGPGTVLNVQLREAGPVQSEESDQIEMITDPKRCL